MVRMRMLTCAVASAMSFHPQVVLAQSAFDGCSCVTPGVGGGAPLGGLATPGADVLVAGPGGFVAAADGEVLVNGSEVTVGARAGGTLSAGTGCTMELSPFKMYSVSQPAGVSGNICVKVSELAPGGGAGSAGGGSAGGGAAGGGAAGGLGAGAKAAAIGLGLAGLAGIGLAIGAGGSSASD